MDPEDSPWLPEESARLLFIFETFKQKISRILVVQVSWGTQGQGNLADVEVDRLDLNPQFPT